jgi:hypothetical protein
VCPHALNIWPLPKPQPNALINKLWKQEQSSVLTNIPEKNEAEVLQ